MKRDEGHLGIGRAESREGCNKEGRFVSPVLACIADEMKIPCMHIWFFGGDGQLTLP